MSEGHTTTNITCFLPERYVDFVVDSVDRKHAQSVISKKNEGNVKSMVLIRW